MSQDPAESSGEPPSYDEQTSYTENEILQPTIFVLAGQSIYAESADSAPLYQMNRGIANLTHATSEVEFERVERSVRIDSTTSNPVIKPRSRQLYTLKYLKNAPGSLQGMPSDSPNYFITAVSSRTVGNVGIKKSRLRPHWKALPIDPSGKHSKLGLPQFIKDAKPLFEISCERHTYRWTDGDGNAVAVEDEGESQHRLLVTASLCRDKLEALVALWCCRVWQDHADNVEPVRSGMGVRSMFNLSKELPGRGSQ